MVSPTLRALRLAGACALVLVAGAATAQEKPRVDVQLKPYLDLVDLYRQAPSAAVERLLAWRPREVEDAYRAFERRTTAVGTIPDVSGAFRALMLHTEAGVNAAARSMKTTATLHLLAATSLLDFIRAREPGDRRMVFAPAAWHLAVVRALNVAWGWEIEEAVLGGGREATLTRRIEDLAEMAEHERAGGGATMLLAFACLEDGSARIEQELRRYEQDRTPIISVDRSSRTLARTARQALLDQWTRHAGELYRKALDRDPQLLEARLRLGRVLTEQRHGDEAREQLRQVLSATTDQRQTYLANLFLGRLEEQGGRTDEALKFYEAALAAWPTSQTARVALASAHERLGDIAAARASLAPLVVRDPVPPDPWGFYFSGQSSDGLESLDQMRRAVMNPPR